MRKIKRTISVSEEADSGLRLIAAARKIPISSLLEDMICQWLTEQPDAVCLIDAIKGNQATNKKK